MIIIDNSYTKLNVPLRGRKPKFKLSKDGNEYIFKYGAINYEIWSELIAEQLGIQAGIEMAHYELACCNNRYGLLTNYFYSPGELIISSDNLKEAIQPIFSENNISANLKDNTICSIIQTAYTYDPNINCEELTKRLLRRWAFYGLIMESDKNATNIAFIRNSEGLRLAPDYDNSSMARMNEDINDLITAMSSGHDIYQLTDSIKNDFKINESDSNNFLTTFQKAVKKFPHQFIEIMDCFKNIDIEKAIEQVESINGVSVPWEVGNWLSIAIGRRMKDMLDIYNKVIEESYESIKYKKI